MTRDGTESEVVLGATSVRPGVVPGAVGGDVPVSSPGSPAPSGPRAGAAIGAARPAELEQTATNCRAREMLDRVGDKWSVYIIHVLDDAGTLRFSELRRRVDGISQRMLTVTLRGMERDGLVRRTMYPEVPPRVEYTLTPLGATLRTIVRELIAWSEAHLPEIDGARARYDRQEQGWAASAD